MKYQVTFNPTPRDLDEIKGWLIAEERIYNSGFYCNWDIIENAFHDSELAVIRDSDSTIGFLVFTKYDLVVKIDIAEIKPDFRKNNFGKVLINHCLQKFKKDNFVAAELYCEPKSSEKFWRRLGFKNFPDMPSTNSQIKMYQELVPTLDHQNSSRKKDLIELWDQEPIIACNRSAKWVWELQFQGNTNKLIKPIIHPAHFDWQICWKQQNKIIVENKVKRFKTADIEFGYFIIINELPRNK